MKNAIIFRALIGAAIGQLISTAIAIGISLYIGKGSYLPVDPSLIESLGTELNAVIAQTVFSLLYGALCGGASCIFEVEGWSLTRQTVTHLVLSSIVALPIGYFLNWIEHSALGILSFFGIFIGIYAIIWISIYLSIKIRLNSINKAL